MRHPGRETPDGLHFLGVDELELHGAQFLMRRLKIPEELRIRKERRWVQAGGKRADVPKSAVLIPDEWLAPSASGPPQQCVDAVLRQFRLGADGVILHGASPVELEPVVRAYAAREGHGHA